MQKLPRTFKKFGYAFKLVRREAKKAIYAQYDGEVLSAYEVVKIRVRPPRYNDLFKRHEPEREVYPTSGQWGIMGWTVKNWGGAWEEAWDRALERFNKL